ncbi:LysM peptidoglycan-binding domain-containing protein [Paenibacillus jiagnxiensis]|uniref:LysM peptidoglycan-binding domain-containing protein n=1 Tax=Paenibacillus jiagnxiensis TaxID=3228926 RepID=UPI0033ACA462
MDNRSYGLRFDIYERVHLTEDVAGIAELEEIELVPRIQVVTQEEHAALRGHLQLQGIYRGEEDEIRELYHQIPVEITIPMNRVTRLEDISMEIENFDVDLLSLRSLNITGVLTLYGVDGTQTEEAPGWGDDSYTAVHTPASEEEYKERSEEDFEQEQQYEQQYQQQQYQQHYQQQYQQQQYQQQYQQQQYQQQQYQYQQQQYEHQSELQREQEQAVNEEPVQTFWVPPSEAAQPQAAEDHTLAEVIRNEDQEIADYTSGNPVVWELEPEREETVKAVAREPESVPEQEPVEVFKQEIPAEDERPEEQISFAEPSVTTSSDTPAEEKKEPKVAFGSKKEKGAVEAEAVPFSSLITQRPAREAELAYDESTDLSVSEEGDEPRTENGKWKTLFQHGFQEENQFRKVRLCIVQREETLETIAERYELSARELQMHNRLSEQNVEEGQVLYIP